MLSNHPSVLGSGAAGVTTPAAASSALDLISTTQGAVLYRDASAWTALTPGTAGQLLSTQGAAANPLWVSATGGAGDMNGPASATDNAIVRFDGIGGKTVQNSAVTIADTTGSTTWGNTGAVLTNAGTTAAANTTTGSLINAGGFGNAGAAFFGGTVSIPYSADSAPALRFNSDSTIGIGSFDGTSLRFAIGGTRRFLMANDSTLYGEGNAAALRLASTGTITLAPTGGTALTLTATTLAATFAGAVTIGNTVNSVSPTSPNRTITMVVGGVTLYIAAKTTND